MNRLITLALCLLLIVPLKAADSESSVNFETIGWDEIVEMSLTMNKPIFLDGYADYCMPCRMMDELVFTDSGVSAFFNQHFISYKVDIQSEEGKLLQFLYDIKALPDLLFIDPRGNVITRSKGSAGVDEVMTLGSNALSLFETKSYENYVPYDNELILAAITETPSERIVNERNERMVSRHAGNIKAPVNKNPVLENFAIELPNRINESSITNIARDIELYRVTGTQEYIDQQITIGLKNAVVKSVSDKSYRGVKRSVRLMKKIGLKDHKNLSFQMEALYSMATGDWVKYARKVDKKFKSNYYVSINLMERAANAILANTEKKAAIRRARKWLKQIKEYSPTTESDSCEYLTDYALIY